jgi:hypothetical protein
MSLTVKRTWFMLPEVKIYTNPLPRWLRRHSTLGTPDRPIADTL